MWGASSSSGGRRVPQRELLLPGALLMAMLAELLAAFVFIDLGLAALFQ
jgi:hypothetical protein